MDDAILRELTLLRHGLCPACLHPLPAQRPRTYTCSEACHAAWIAQIIARHGETRPITSSATGKTYLVPTRVILEQGITGADLPRFPEAPPTKP